MGKSRADLAPGFLIASPPLGDPNFDRTVVLLVQHGAEGALGFVVNRTLPLGLHELLTQAGYDVGATKGGAPVHYGGPVQPTSGWLLAAELGAHEGTLPVADGLDVSPARTAFDALAKTAKELDAATFDAQHRLVLLGYSGWGPGQLEGEIAAGAWLPVPFDAAILFDTPVEQRWERAYALMGLTPAGMMTMRTGGAA